MTNIAIIEDHLLLAETLEYVLKTEADISFLGSAGGVQSGLALVKKCQPDVLIIEADLPDGSGFDLIKQLGVISPRTRCIVFARDPDEAKLMMAINSGVHGFFSKNCPLSELLKGIRRVAGGETVLPQHMLVDLVKQMSRRSNSPAQRQQRWEPLTSREMEILHNLARGKSGDIIAAELNITTLTVRTHIRNIMSKLGVHSRLEAVSFAMSNGLIEMGY